MHELYIRYSAEEKETIVLSVKRSEPEYCSGPQTLRYSKAYFL